MSSIGAYNFVSIKGPPIPSLAVAMAPIKRAGVDGSAFRRDAKGVPEIILQATSWAVSETLALTSPDLYAALVGSLVTVVDDLGRTVNNVMVLACQVTRISRLGVSTEPTAEFMIRSVWKVQPTGL
jgi:hypothetical protein